MAEKDRLEQQFAFLVEIDQMKSILRRNILIDRSRQEDDAGHCWHMAMTALVLREYAADSDVDMLRVLKMVLVHDLVEVYAGDTFCYDAAGNADKANREQLAADRLFALLPAEQGSAYRALWEEFDRMESADAIYAAAADRLQPFLLNYHTDGHTWKLGDIDTDMLYARLAPIGRGMPLVWQRVKQMIRSCQHKGMIRPGKKPVSDWE